MKSIVMPALTICQPHATLTVSGHKKYETRGYRYPQKFYGKRIAIHAGKNKADIKELIKYEGPVGRCFVADDFYNALEEAVGSIVNLPLGCVVGTAVLRDCIPTASLSDPGPFGDFSEGRFAWEFSDLEMFINPIPAKGAQGFWKWKMKL